MDNQRENDVIEIDLMELVMLLLNRIWLIVSVGLLAALTGFLISKFVIAPYYESTTKIYILNKSESAAVTYSDVQMGTQLTKDYAQLITSRYVLEEVIQKLGLTEDYKELLNRVEVSTPADTRIVAITVENTDPVAAMETANCIREVASQHISNVMDIDAVNVVETANMPMEKAGPGCLKWTAIAGLLGVLFVCGIVIVKYLMDDTIKSSEEVEKYLGLSTLALIPISTGSTVTKGKNKKK